MHLIKRKFIFILRDKKGQIDVNDIFLLKKLSSIFRDIKVVLCGSFYAEDSESVIERFCNSIEYRTFDCSEFQILKEEVLLLSGKDEVDELIIADNSIFGPFYEMKAILNTIWEKDYDFWGLTKMGEVVNDAWEVYPAHLQMYFWGIGKKLLHSKDLLFFFQQKEDCLCFEEEFTSFFGQNGYSWGTYIDIPKYNSNSVTNNINLLYEVSYELILYYNFPFLKRDYFARKEMNNSTNADLRKTMAFLNKRNLYDSDMIWDFVLKHYNIVQIKDSMNLNYILPAARTGKKIQEDGDDCYHTVVIMHLAYEESLDEVWEYIIAIPEKIQKIFVVISETVEKHLKKKLLEVGYGNYEIRIMLPNRGRDMNSLFVVCKDVWSKYSYLCFVHDKRTSGDTGSFLVGKEFMNLLWDNTLKSRDYIYEILALLKGDKRLGYLTVPAPYHDFYYETMAKAWAKSYEVTKDLAKKMNLEVEISNEFQPFALGNAFWCKTDALKDIINYDLKTNDFSAEPMPRDGTISHALERIMIFAAQNAGYYSGIIENTEYAARELNNKNFMWESLVKKIILRPQFCRTGTFSRMVRLLNDVSFEEFLKKRKKIYIWGAGKTGKNLNRELKKRGYMVQGYICSQGYPKPWDCDGRVYYLSEIDCDNSEVGIVLAVHKKFYEELSPTLKKLGDKVYYL